MWASRFVFFGFGVIVLGFVCVCRSAWLCGCRFLGGAGGLTMKNGVGCPNFRLGWRHNPGGWSLE